MKNLLNLIQQKLDFSQFIRDYVTQSWWLTGWLVILTSFTIYYLNSRLAVAPISTSVILIVWVISLGMVVVDNIRHKHSKVTNWMKDNIYSNITNAQITLIISLVVVASIIGLYKYSWQTASFSTIPATKIRAEQSSDYCFSIGEVEGVGPEAKIIDGKEQCFTPDQLAQGYVPEMVTSINEIPGQLCFDQLPDDPDNGTSCFDNRRAEPGLFKVTYRFSGANWGAVRANLTTLLIFRFQRNQMWRIWSSLILLAGLFVATQFVYKDSFANKQIRKGVTGLWLLSPLVGYVLLRGLPAVPYATDSFGASITGFGATIWQNGTLLGLIFAGLLLWADQYQKKRYLPERNESEWIRLGRIGFRFVWFLGMIYGVLSLLNLFSLFLGSFNYQLDGEQTQLFVALDPDFSWGGFLLTVIITVFAVVVSFPLGLILALGRRSEITGIPSWLTYGAAVLLTGWLLVTVTPDLLEGSRNGFERFLSYWPLLIIPVAVLFQRSFNGNVLAAFSTLYIEFVRGTPLIVVLFLTIILFPLLLPAGMEILDTWRVIWGFTLFAAAYLAENIRGGLQAITKGQYEAADSLGLSVFDKYRIIILPQAIRVVIPAIVGQFIGLFKDTTLVAIVGMLDILGVANAISAQPEWLGVRREAYIFIAILYYVGSALMTRYSDKLERDMGLGQY